MRNFLFNPKILVFVKKINDSLSEKKGLSQSAICLVLILILSNSLFAGAIRHDVPDEKYINLGNQDQFSSVGLILLDDQPNASCVLIDSEWVLTAGHEAEGRTADRFRVQFGNDKYEVKEVIINPEYQSKVLGHGIDLALLKLDKPIKSIKPALIYTGSDLKGKIGTSVGFGRSGAGKTMISNPTPTGTKRAGQNIIDSLGGAFNQRNYPENLLIADFDYPDSNLLNVIGDSKPLELEYCPVGGDSGGGLFIEADGKWFLAGTFTGLSVKINDDENLGIYGSVVYWTRVTPNQDWIQEVIKGK